MRGRMRDAFIESYVEAFTLNERCVKLCVLFPRGLLQLRNVFDSITGYGVAVVLRSENPEAKQGDYVTGMISKVRFYCPHIH